MWPNIPHSASLSIFLIVMVLVVDFLNCLRIKLISTCEILRSLHTGHQWKRVQVLEVLLVPGN